MLSVVITSRADGYGGTNLARVLAHYATWRLRPEVILVDWNPLPGAQIVGGTRRIEVPPEIHRLYPTCEKLNLYYHIGQNVGIRRARGEWILSTSQDVLVPEIDEDYLSLDCFYRLPRWDEEPDGKLAPHGPHGPQGEPVFANAAGDFILMHRSSWDLIRGFPEWAVHPIYLDGLACYQAHLSGLREVIMPGFCRHLYHRHGDVASVPHLDYIGDYCPLCEYAVKRGCFPMINGEDWGLARLQEVDGRLHYWGQDSLMRARPMSQIKAELGIPYAAIREVYG